jgi:hypothetical protein
MLGVSCRPILASARQPGRNNSRYVILGDMRGHVVITISASKPKAGG